MFIFKRGNSLKNVQHSTKKKPKNVAVLRTVVKKKAAVRLPKAVVEEVVETPVKETKKKKNKEEENI